MSIHHVSPRQPWVSISADVDPAMVRVRGLGPGYNFVVQLGGVELHVSEFQWDAIHAAVKKGIETIRMEALS